MGGNTAALYTRGKFPVLTWIVMLHTKLAACATITVLGLERATARSTTHGGFYITHSWIFVFLAKQGFVSTVPVGGVGVTAGGRAALVFHVFHANNFVEVAVGRWAMPGVAGAPVAEIA